MQAFCVSFFIIFSTKKFFAYNNKKGGIIMLKYIVYFIVVSFIYKLAIKSDFLITNLDTLLKMLNNLILSKLLTF